MTSWEKPPAPERAFAFLQGHSALVLSGKRWRDLVPSKQERIRWAATLSPSLGGSLPREAQALCAPWALCPHVTARQSRLAHDKDVSPPRRPSGAPLNSASKGLRGRKLRVPAAPLANFLVCSFLKQGRYLWGTLTVPKMGSILHSLNHLVYISPPFQAVVSPSVTQGDHTPRRPTPDIWF